MTLSLTVLLMRTSGLVMRVDMLQNEQKVTAKPITPITGHACTVPRWTCDDRSTKRPGGRIGWGGGAMGATRSTEQYQVRTIRLMLRLRIKNTPDACLT